MSTTTSSVSPLGCSSRSDRRMRSSDQPEIARAGTYWQNAAGRSLRVERDREQQPAVVGLERAPERHREPALDVALAALGHQLAELALERGIELGRVEHLDAVAGLAHPRDRLAQALVLLAVETEPARRRPRPRHRCTGRACRSRRTPGASRRTRPSPPPTSRARRRTRGTPTRPRRAATPGRPGRARRARCRCAPGTRPRCRDSRTSPCRSAARSTTASRSRSAPPGSAPARATSDGTTPCARRPRAGTTTTAPRARSRCRSRAAPATGARSSRCGQRDRPVTEQPERDRAERVADRQARPVAAPRRRRRPRSRPTRPTSPADRRAPRRASGWRARRSRTECVARNIAASKRERRLLDVETLHDVAGHAHAAAGRGPTTRRGAGRGARHARGTAARRRRARPAPPRPPEPRSARTGGDHRAGSRAGASPTTRG